jgi:hypothetical protein
MGVSDPAFPSSQAFDLIGSALDASEADRKDAIKKGGAIFGFTLKNSTGGSESWFIDLKKDGKVGKGGAPEGEKANGMLLRISLAIEWCVAPLVEQQLTRGTQSLSPLTTRTLESLFAAQQRLRLSS